MPNTEQKFVSIYPVEKFDETETISSVRFAYVCKLADLLQSISHVTLDFVIVDSQSRIVSIEDAAAMFGAVRTLERINKNREVPVSLSRDEFGVYRQSQHEKIGIQPESAEVDEDQESAA